MLGDASLFRGMHKVMPGHYQVVDLATLAIRTEKYWEPTSGSTRTTPRTTSSRKCAAC